MMASATTEHTFLYPVSRQFPFDEVCEQIVRALEERNWDVPGITVVFDTYGTGANKFRLVRKITTDDCVLRFGRPQGNMGRWNDTAAISDIIIPMMELRVYEDESGPTYYVYVGNDWDSDKKHFVDQYKINSKLNGEPRTYLKYKGACNCSSTRGASFEAVSFLTANLMGDRKALRAMTHEHRGRRSPILVHDNDLNREYDLEDGEEPMYQTADVFAEFTQWLDGNILQKILATPVVVEHVDHFAMETTPFPDTIGPIYCFGEYHDAERVRQGNVDASKLAADDRYGFTGSGYRLASLGVRGDFPEVAYDGFKWCAFGDVAEDTSIDDLVVPGHYRWSDREAYVFRLKLNRANGVYVAENAAFENRRQAMFEAIKPRDRLTDDKVNQAIAARAATIVPITEYDGTFQEPVVLVNREIGLDEVELVSGPWPGYREKMRAKRS
jgi:hypothetical protein